MNVLNLKCCHAATYCCCSIIVVAMLLRLAGKVRPILNSSLVVEWGAMLISEITGNVSEKQMKNLTHFLWSIHTNFSEHFFLFISYNIAMSSALVRRRACDHHAVLIWVMDVKFTLDSRLSQASLPWGAATVMESATVCVFARHWTGQGNTNQSLTRDPHRRAHKDFPYAQPPPSTSADSRTKWREFVCFQCEKNIYRYGTMIHIFLSAI